MVSYQAKDHLLDLAGPDVSAHSEVSCLQWTHTQLHRAATTVASSLAARGIHRGATLVTLIPNRVEWLVLQYAAVICRASFAPLDFGALNQARAIELQNATSRLKPDAIVVSGNQDAMSVNQALAAAKHVPKLRIVLEESIGSSTNNWVSLLSLTANNNEKAVQETKLLENARTLDPDRIDLICFTSGTSSGNPKGCPRHEEGNAASLEAQETLFNFDKSSRYLLSSANFRIIAREWPESFAPSSPDDQSHMQVRIQINVLTSLQPSSRCRYCVKEVRLVSRSFGV